jgi:hypothetical protein
MIVGTAAAIEVIVEVTAGVVDVAGAGAAEDGAGAVVAATVGGIMAEEADAIYPLQNMHRHRANAIRGATTIVVRIAGPLDHLNRAKKRFCCRENRWRNIADVPNKLLLNR